MKWLRKSKAAIEWSQQQQQQSNRQYTNWLIIFGGLTKAKTQQIGWKTKGAHAVRCYVLYREIYFNAAQ